MSDKIRPDRLVIDYDGNGEFTISDDNDYQCGVLLEFNPISTDYENSQCYEFAQHLVELYNKSRLKNE